MIAGFAYRCLRALLFRLPPEAAHRLALGSCEALQRAGLLRWGVTTPPLSPRRVMGLDFPHPIGLAAGLDKDARYVSGLFGLGFGFVELGTVTLQPQSGNPQPRLFRLPHQEALINRMGFNSAGAAAVAAHLAQRPAGGGIIGISIGTGRNTPRERAGSECAEVMRKLYPSADYVAVNLSSPNTPGLRELQREDLLQSLVEALYRERERLTAEFGVRKPIAIKLSPDLGDDSLVRLAGILRRLQVDAVIATNTTVARPPQLRGRHGDESGGLSGRPLEERALHVTRLLVGELGTALPVIASGGLADAAAVRRRLAAGAVLIQLYTGLIYRGPALIAEAARQARIQDSTESRE